MSWLDSPSYEDLMRHAPKLTVARMMDCLAAAHFAYRVRGPSPDRGGIMLVGPPASLKSTMIGWLAKRYSDVLEMTDLNVQKLVQMRPMLQTGRYKTIALPEVAKVFERSESVSANVEGHLRAMTAEGFKEASFEVPINQPPARCLVIGAMTPEVRQMHAKRWNGNGFSRRFLWCSVTFSGARMRDCILGWHALKVAKGAKFILNGKERLRSRVSKRIAEVLLALVSHQPVQENLQAELLGRMYSVLAYTYEGRRDDPDRAALDTLLAFGRTLGDEGHIA